MEVQQEHCRAQGNVSCGMLLGKINCSIWEMPMKVGVVCCKNHVVVGTMVAARGMMDKYTCKSSVCSRIPNCVLLSSFNPQSTVTRYTTTRFILPTTVFCSGAIIFWRFQRVSRGLGLFLLYLLFPFPFPSFKIYLYLADGCVGGGCRMGALGFFLSECFY